MCEYTTALSLSERANAGPPPPHAPSCAVTQKPPLQGRISRACRSRTIRASLSTLPRPPSAQANTRMQTRGTVLYPRAGRSLSVSGAPRAARASIRSVTAVQCRVSVYSGFALKMKTTYGIRICHRTPEAHVNRFEDEGDALALDHRFGARAAAQRRTERHHPFYTSLRAGCV